MIEKVKQILGSIPFPGTDRDLVSFGVIREVRADGKRIVVSAEVLGREPALAVEVERMIRETTAAAGVTDVVVDMKFRQFGGIGQPGQQGQSGQAAPAGPHGASPDPFADRQAIAGVDHVVAVASGKGGVGKSTIAVNLALGLAARGLKIGLLDADIYGPSEPVMLGVSDAKPASVDGQKLEPIEAHGLKTMSIGYLIEDDRPVIWRGPLIMKMINQFLRDVNWGELDVLVVDLPPGTGDAQLSLVQKIPIDGVIIVTTPQDVALADVLRGKVMFDKVEVPILGVVENMSWFNCPHCGERSEIFSHGGGAKMAEELHLDLLGEIPLDADLRASMDRGEPVVIASPDGEQAQNFLALADKVISRVLPTQ